jgi:hypothetical protein
MESHKTETISHGVPLRCSNTKCGYEWQYTGRFFIYATCPSCRRNVKIAENKVETLQSVQVRGHRQTAAAKGVPT